MGLAHLNESAQGRTDDTEGYQRPGYLEQEHRITKVCHRQVVEVSPSDELVRGLQQPSGNRAHSSTLASPALQAMLFNAPHKPNKKLKCRGVLPTFSCEVVDLHDEHAVQHRRDVDAYLDPAQRYVKRQGRTRHRRS